MNYVDLAVAQSAVLRRIGDPKTDAAYVSTLVEAYRRLVEIERPSSTSPKPPVVAA